MKILKQMAIIALVCYGQSIIAESVATSLARDINTAKNNLNILLIMQDQDLINDLGKLTKQISHNAKHITKNDTISTDIMQSCYGVVMDWLRMIEKNEETPLSQKQLKTVEHDCKQLQHDLNHIASKIGIELREQETYEEYLARR